MTDLDPTIVTKINELFTVPSPDERLFAPGSQQPQISAAQLGMFALGGTTDSKVADWTTRYTAAHEAFTMTLGALVDRGDAADELTSISYNDIVSAAAYFEPHPLSDEQISDVIRRAVDAPSMVRWTDTLVRLIGLLSLESRTQLQADLAEHDSIRWAKLLRESGNVDNPVIKEAVEPRDQASPRAVKVLAAKALAKSSTETLDTMFGPKMYLRGVENELVMVRYLEIDQFSAWKKAYEAAATWQKLGFEHIPVEPILDYQVDPRHGGTHVRTVFLRGSNYSDAEAQLTGKAKKRLQQQRFEIKRGLDSLGIDHGHLHADNFVAVDVGNEMRLYVIDFDLAFIRAKHK